MARYCRLANGRARVPTRAELAALCTGRSYRSCAGYRRWAASLAWAEREAGLTGGAP
jgi:hypothetical protein